MTDEEDRPDIESTKGQSESPTSMEQSSTEDTQPTSSTGISDSSSQTQSCSAWLTTVTDCAVGCSEVETVTDNSVVSSTICYTTKCEPTVGCSIEPKTATSISNSEGEACLWAAATRYDALATFREAG